MSKKTLIIIISSIVAVISALVAVLIITNNVKYTITFNSDGGSPVQEQIVKKGDKVTKPTDPMKEGYRFISWTLNGNTYDFSLEVTSDMELKATWYEIKEEVKEYIVKFNTGGGTTIENQIVEEGKKVTKPEAPTKEGYTFKGWYLDGKEYDFETEVTKDIELETKWEKIEETNNNIPNEDNNDDNNNEPTVPTVKQYTVTFDSKGGSSVPSQAVEESKKVQKPSDPTREGYTFAGWTLNGNDYNFDSSVTGNITLVATWTENEKAKYTVTFDSKGGSSVPSQEVEEGNKVQKPSDPTREAYTFAGWTLNGSSYNFDSSLTENITLVASWNQKSYRVVANKVDNISPARVLTVYEDGNVITVGNIQYSDGSSLCSGQNPNVNYYAIEGETSVRLVLSGGTIVNASLTIN